MRSERGFSSVGRALALQARCQEFESPNLQIKYESETFVLIFDITIQVSKNVCAF